MIRGKKCKVTNFGDPHLFFILYDEQNNAQKELENDLKKRFVDQVEMIPKKDQLYLVQHNGIYKRAVALTKTDSFYCCWLVDYGELIWENMFYTLPPFCNMKPLSIKAGLNNTAGLESFLNHETGIIEFKTTLNFSTGACRSMQQHLENAKEIYFKEDRIIRNVYFGEIFLLMNDYSNRDLIQTLKKERIIVVDENKFREVLEYTMNNDLKKKYINEDAVGLGRGCYRTNPETLPKITISTEEQVDNWVSSTVHEIFVLADSCAPKQEEVVDESDQFTNSQCRETTECPEIKSCEETKEDEQPNSLNTISEADSSLEIESPPSKLNNKSGDKVVGPSKLRRIREVIQQVTNTNKKEAVTVDTNQKEAVSDDANQVINMQCKEIIESPAIKSCEGNTECTPTEAEQLNSMSEADSSLDMESTPSKLSNESREIVVGPSRLRRIREVIQQVTNRSKMESQNDSSVPNTTTDDDRSLPDMSTSDAEELEIHTKYNSSSDSDKISLPKSRNRSILQAYKNRKLANQSKSDSEPNSSDAAIIKTGEKAATNSSESDSVSDDGFVNNKQNKVLRKFRCNCAECVTWEGNDFDTVKEEFGPKCAKSVIRPPLLLKVPGEEDVNLSIKSLSQLLNDSPISRKMTCPNLLIHGTVIPFPQKLLSEIPFIEPIHKAMRSRGYIRCRVLQQCCWPAIMRSMNLCLVNSASSGKTFTYLPAMCSFLMEKDTRYSSLPRINGPLAVVLCAESREVENIYHSFNHLMMAVKSTTKLNIAQAVVPLDTVVMAQFKSPCDILITTPTTLHLLLAKNVFNLKRLCHFIVENIDVVLDNFKEPFQAILKVVQEMLEHRMCAKQVQFICTAEHWTVRLERFLKTLSSVPLVCIGNHIEAALYGRADIQIKDVQFSAKPSVLYDLIKDSYRVYKTIIVCNYNDIQEIQKLFRLYGISLLIADDTTKGEDISEILQSWSSKPGGEHIILICTDFVLRAHIVKSDCSILVHYSLPDSWHLFIKRWSCLLDNYQSPLMSSSQNTFNCKIYIFIDNTRGKELTKIISYFKNVGPKLPQKIEGYYNKFKELKETEKVQRGIPLCDKWKCWSKCSIHHCTSRHVLNSKLDLSQPNFSGTLKFNLTYIRDLNNFQIKPIEYETYDGEIHKVDDTKGYIDQQLEEFRVREFAGRIQIDGLYIFEEDKLCLRCVVKKIVEYDPISKIPCKVVIEGIDTSFNGKVSTSNIFNIPDKLRNIPRALMDLKVVNIKPLNKEKQWSIRSKKLLIQTIEENSDVDVYFTGNIVLHLGNTVWMENFQMQKHLEYMKQYVTCFSLVTYLEKNDFVQIDKSRLTELYAQCAKYNLNLPEYKVKQQVRQKLTQPTGQWAHLPSGPFNMVQFSAGYTPRNFYVKLEKFRDLYINFHKSLQELVKSRKHLKLEDIFVGNYYLAPDPDNDNAYCRALVTDIIDNQVDCFYVDYGDCYYVDASKIKSLPNEYITKLPFQVIQCGLYGLQSIEGDSWPDDTVNILYKYSFEKDNDYYRTLYTHVIKEETGRFANTTKYNILLYEYSESIPIMINKVFIDCGLAVHKKDECLEVDFNLKEELDKFHTCDYDADLDDDELEGAVLEKDVGKPPPDWNAVVDDFEFTILDEEQFCEEFCQKLNSKALASTSNVTKSNDLPTMKALPMSTTYSPDVLWYQLGKVIKIDIKLTAEKYDIKLIAGRVLSFEANYDSRNYSLKLDLFDLVNKSFSHTSFGPLVKVTLMKIKDTEWPRLILSKQPMKNIKYNLDKIAIPEEEKRTFLKADKADDDDEIVDGYIDEIGSDYSDSDLSVSWESD